MDKIFIKDLLVQAIIGIREWERKTPQAVLINVTIFTQERSTSAPDNIDGCVDYSNLTDRIRTLVETGNRYTLEALAEDIASLCLTTEKVMKVITRVEKPDALTSAASAGVEIERSRRL